MSRPNRAYEPPTQEELDRIIHGRLARDRATREHRPTVVGDNPVDEPATGSDRDAQVKPPGGPDPKALVEEARRDGALEGIREAAPRLIEAEARTLAAELGFLYPRDAPRLIDLTDVEVTTEGDVDTATIRTRLDQLAESRPMLLESWRRPARRSP